MAIEASLRGALLLSAALFLGHCGGGDGDSEAGRLGAGSVGATSGGANLATSTSTSTTGGVPPEDPPPEDELESSFRAPVATGKYLWSANPQSGRVAIIDTEVLDIRIADAGFGPTYLAAVPREDAAVSSAIVINIGSQDATLFGIDAEGVLSSQSFPTHAGANRWSVSSLGRWACAWSDASEVESPDPTDGFQDVTLIETSRGQVTRLSVGYRPTQVVFDASEHRLFVVSEPGISIIDLEMDPPETVELVDLEEGSPDAPLIRDVSIAADGSMALVRVEGSHVIDVIPLAGGDPQHFELSGPVTDLDLSQDGSRAVAVVRSRSEIAVMDVPRLQQSDAVEVLHIPDAVFGSVSLSPDADVAVLYSNAIQSTRATIVSLEAGDDYLTNRTVDLKSGVRAMFVAPDGEHAIALLDVPEASSKAGAFSVLVTKAERAPKIVGTEAPPVAVALSPGQPSTRALLTTRDDATGVFEALMVSLPGLQVDSFALASPPLATGIMTDRALGYVAQMHPEGRITFVDLERTRAQTLTGFELATKVVD